MSMNSKISKYRKSKIILNLKKFSNVILFSRREDEFLKRSKSSFKTFKTLANKKNKSYNKRTKNKTNKLTTPSDELSTYALKTFSSFKNSFDSFSTKIIFPKKLMSKNQIDKETNPYFTISSFRSENKTNNHKNNLNKKNKKQKNNKNNIFYLTQDNLKENLKINDQRFNTINNTNSKKNIICFKEKENEIKLLKQINFKQEKEMMNKDEKYLLNLKLHKMDSEKYNISLMLNKLRVFKYYNYLNEQKKEINITSMENSKNNIEFINDKIKTLNNMKYIYNEKIANRLGEYSKFITNYKEREKINSDILLNQINRLKKEVKNLQNKIAKKEQERLTILKWIYFFIKMKEKKLVLPAYYKKIVETNFERKKEKRKTIVINLQNIKSIQEKHKSFFSHHHHDNAHGKDLSNKLLSHVRLSTFNGENLESFNKNNISKKNDNINPRSKNSKKFVSKGTVSYKKNSMQLYVFKSNDLNNSNHIFNFEDSAEVNQKLKTTFDKLIQDGISVSEINRISKYKLSLIYETPEDLNDRLTELQNENVQLLRQYEIARKKLSAKKIKYQEIREFIYEDGYYDLIERIKERELELNQIKKKYESLIKFISEAKKHSNQKSNVINIKQKRNRSLNKTPVTQESIRKELFSKIENLYEVCLNNIENPNSNILLKDKTKKDVIYKLKIIEFFVVNLKSKLNFKDKSNITKYELMRKIKNEIEHKHKIEKGQILRLKEKERFKNFQEEIEEKIKKILFLQKRRIIPVYNWDNMNKEKIFTHERKLNFEDFMFD